MQIRLCYTITICLSITCTLVYLTYKAIFHYTWYHSFKLEAAAFCQSYNFREMFSADLSSSFMFFFSGVSQTISYYRSSQLYLETLRHWYICKLICLKLEDKKMKKGGRETEGVSWFQFLTLLNIVTGILMQGYLINGKVVVNNCVVHQNIKFFLFGTFVKNHTLFCTFRGMDGNNISRISRNSLAPLATQNFVHL